MDDLWDAASGRLPRLREDRPRPARLRDHEPPPAGRHAAARGDEGRPRRARAGVRRGARARARHRPARSATPRASAGARATQIDDGRSWLWLEDDVVLFKAEASAWTPTAVQVSAGLGRPGRAPPGLRRARASRPLPPPARDDSDRDAVRPQRERARDRALRAHRHAPGARVPEPPVLIRSASMRLWSCSSASNRTSAGTS